MENELCGARLKMVADESHTQTGDLALSPAAQTCEYSRRCSQKRIANCYSPQDYTGFALTESDTGTYATSSQVTGRMFAATDAAPTPSVLTSAYTVSKLAMNFLEHSSCTAAVSDMGTAFTDAASRSGNASTLASLERCDTELTSLNSFLFSSQPVGFAS